MASKVPGSADPWGIGNFWCFAISHRNLSPQIQKVGSARMRKNNEAYFLTAECLALMAR